MGFSALEKEILCKDISGEPRQKEEKNSCVYKPFFEQREKEDSEVKNCLLRRGLHHTTRMPQQPDKPDINMDTTLQSPSHFKQQQLRCSRDEHSQTIRATRKKLSQTSCGVTKMSKAYITKHVSMYLNNDTISTSEMRTAYITKQVSMYRNKNTIPNSEMKHNEVSVTCPKNEERIEKSRESAKVSISFGKTTKRSPSLTSITTKRTISMRSSSTATTNDPMLLPVGDTSPVLPPRSRTTPNEINRGKKKESTSMSKRKQKGHHNRKRISTKKPIRRPIPTDIEGMMISVSLDNENNCDDLKSITSDITSPFNHRSHER